MIDDRVSEVLLPPRRYSLPEIARVLGIDVPSWLLEPYMVRRHFRARAASGPTLQRKPRTRRRRA